MIFDDRGMPWTIRLSLGWTIVLALCCAGALFLPLGIYLAYCAEVLPLELALRFGLLRSHATHRNLCRIVVLAFHGFASHAPQN